MSSLQASYILSPFQFTEPCDTPVYMDELDCAIPEGVWRIGRPCGGEDEESGGGGGGPQRIFMALAPFVSDVQLSPQNLREKNAELRKFERFNASPVLRFYLNYSLRVKL